MLELARILYNIYFGAREGCLHIICDQVKLISDICL